MKGAKSTVRIFSIIFLITIALLFFGCTSTQNTKIGPVPIQKISEKQLSKYGLSTNTVIKSVNLSDIISGGPGKDGIPAIRKPKFTGVSGASNTITPQTLGIAAGINEKKFYPYNILVWHEVVDDKIDGIPVAITFCPLCGSAIVFNRQIDNKTVLEFGVSGLLYQSNLLMYGNETESLWSQVRGEAVIGDYTGKKLQIIKSDLLNFSDFKSKYPNGKVLSTDTGYQRDYSFYPYGDYDANSEIYFPTKKFDNRLPLKEIVYVIRVDDGVAVFPIKDLKIVKEADLEVNGKKIIVVSKDGEIVSSVNEIETPGYYAMYFSVVAQENNVTMWKK